MRRMLVVGVGLLVVALVLWFAVRRQASKVPVEASATTGAGAARPSPTGSGNRGEATASDAGPNAGTKAPLTGRLVKRAAWGSGPDQLGRRAADESNPEGPMAMVVDKEGNLLVLDQVNARISRFDSQGKLLGTVPIGPDTAQDLAVGPDGTLAVIDRVGEGQLLTYDETGALTGELPLQGGPITEAGGVTGVFLDESGAYVEREHTESVKLAGADGEPDPDRPPAPGRPTRSGSGFVSAQVADRAGGLATVRMFNPDRDMIWQRPVTFSSPIVVIAMLDSDRTGQVYLAVHIADENSSSPSGLTNERIVVVRLSEADGAGTGTLILPAPTAPEESFRPLSVGDDGVVYQLVFGPEGVELVAYTFP